jgi:hypothetical protein
MSTHFVTYQICEPWVRNLNGLFLPKWERVRQDSSAETRAMTANAISWKESENGL